MDIARDARPPPIPLPAVTEPDRRDGARRSLEHWFLLALPFVGLAVLALFAFVIEPDPRGHGTHEKLGLPSCKMMEWFHVPCPGCGVTTSVALAARGKFLQSIHNQPFGILVALAIPIAALWVLAGHLRGRDLWRDLQAVRIKPWAIAAGAVLGACWIYKLALTFGLLR